MIMATAAASTAQLTACLICAIRLFRNRRGMSEYVRLLVGICAILFVVQSLATLRGLILTSVDTPIRGILGPNQVLFGLLAQIASLIYPLCLMRPNIPPPLLKMFAPWLLLLIIYGIMPEWVELYSISDIGANLGHSSVILRLVTLVLYLPFLVTLILLLLDTNTENDPSSRTRRVFFGASVAVLMLIDWGYFFTNNLNLYILHQILIAIFFCTITAYELEERLYPKRGYEYLPPTQRIAERRERKTSEVEEKKVKPVPEVNDQTLWERICNAMNVEEVWKKPNLSVDSLARECGTNVSYLSAAIKKETGFSANEYINRTRIKYVCDSLESDPSQSLNEVFYNAGFRSRTTAWRNFRDIVGVTPSDYRFSKR